MRVISQDKGTKKVVMVANHEVAQSSANPQQPSSSLSGLMAQSSRSPRKDNLSSGRAEIRRNPELPLTADEAIKYYGRYLNDYEK